MKKLRDWRDKTFDNMSRHSFSQLLELIGCGLLIIGALIWALATAPSQADIKMRDLQIIDSQRKLSEFMVKYELLERTCSEEFDKLNKKKELYAEWVYKNSIRVSRKEVLNIVDLVFETKYPLFMLATFAKESSFRAGNVSTKSNDPNNPPDEYGYVGIGLGMITNIHTQELIEAGIINERRDLFDPAVNIKATEYIIDQKLETGTIHSVLKMYLGTSSGSYNKTIYGNFLELWFISTLEEKDGKETIELDVPAGDYHHTMSR